MSLTNASANAVLDKILGDPITATGIWPATVYIGLLKSEPNPDGTGVDEVTGGAYARQPSTNNATEWPGASSRLKTHASNIVFPAATANWGTITHVGIFDAVSGGSILAYGALATSRVINTTDVYRFLAGSKPLNMTIPAAAG